MTSIEIRLLGEPAIIVDGDERAVSRPREQSVLARLALATPGAVTVDALVEDVWGERPPATAVDALRVHVSSLRKAVAGAGIDPTDVLVTCPGAYRFELATGAVDVHRFETAVRDHDIGTLRDLLRGWAEHDLGRLDSGSGFFTAAAQHVADLRATATELIAEADLGDERADRAVRVLEEFVHREPYRERAWELLVRSLQDCGRRTEALRTARRARQTLAEVGMEPGPGLAAAEEAVLAPERSRAVARPPSDYVNVNGSRIAFTTWGGPGPDLLFLHGGFVPFEVMPDEPRFAQFLERLADRYRVVLLDRRGIGMSDPPADGTPVSLDHWVADCRAVLDAVGSRRCLVFGHENGGPVAIRLAAEQPERIRGLVLHSTVAKYLRSDDHPYGPSQDAWDRINRIIDRLPGADDVVTLVAPSVGDDPGLRAWLDRAGRLGAGPARAKELHRIYLDVDVRPFLDQVRAPVIVLQPARRIGSDPGQARYITQQLADAELELLDSADHLPFLADADAVLDAIDRIAQRAAGPRETATKVLRALVGVAPAVVVDVIGQHRPETCLELDGALVAVFPSRLAAERCAADLTERHPDATAVVQLDDTLATADDDAVLAVADAARRRQR